MKKVILAALATLFVFGATVGADAGWVWRPMRQQWVWIPGPGEVYAPRRMAPPPVVVVQPERRCDTLFHIIKHCY